MERGIIMTLEMAITRYIPKIKVKQTKFTLSSINEKNGKIHK